MRFLVFSDADGGDIFVNREHLVAIVETGTVGVLEVHVTGGKSFNVTGEAEEMYRIIEHNSEDASYVRL